MRRSRPYGAHEPGTYARVPAWRSRDAWLALVDQDLATDEVTELRRSLGRGPVAVRPVARIAAAVAAAADSNTGRNAMPGVEELVTALGLSESTVQRALRVLERRGWLVVVRAGKNRLSLDDRLALWASGSAARQQRTVWACTIPTHARRPAYNRTPEPAQPSARRPSQTRSGAVDNAPPATSSSTAPPEYGPPAPTGTDQAGALPTTRRVERVGTEPAKKNLNSHNASRTGPAGRTPTKDGSKNPAGRTFRPRRADGRTVVLAHDLREQLFWLRGCPSWQLRPALDRFARAGWTATDIHHALDKLLTTRGWTPLTSPDRPWAYLSWLLRHLEPTDLIADREHAAALTATAARWDQLRRTGPECPHRMPAGHLPNPHTGQPDCPLCRRTSA